MFNITFIKPEHRVQTSVITINNYNKYYKYLEHSRFLATIRYCVQNKVCYDEQVQPVLYTLLGQTYEHIKFLKNKYGLYKDIV